jgi:hypothetical protein
MRQRNDSHISRNAELEALATSLQRASLEMVDDEEDMRRRFDEQSREAAEHWRFKLVEARIRLEELRAHVG